MGSGCVSRVSRILVVDFWSSLAEVAGSESSGREETPLRVIVANKKVAVESALNNMPDAATGV